MVFNQRDKREGAVKSKVAGSRTFTFGMARKPGVIMASSKDAMKSHQEIVDSTAATIYRHRRELFRET